MIRKRFLALALLAFLAVSLSAQSPGHLDGRWTVKLMHSVVKPTPNRPVSGFWEAAGVNLIEANYGFAKCLEGGIHFGGYGHTPWPGPYPPEITSPVSLEGVEPQYIFGANLNVHPLPLLVRHRLPIDLYGALRLRDEYQLRFEAIGREHVGMAGAGGGAAIYLGRHIGLNFEYLRYSLFKERAFSQSSWDTYNLGLTYKFR